MAKIVFVDTHITGIKSLFDKMQADFEKAGYEFVRGECKNKEEIMSLTKDADVIITTYAPIDREIINNAKNLKMLIRNAIGYEILDIPAATERGIPVCNVPDYCTEEVAEHTLALILACARKLKPSAELVRRGEWKIRCAYPINRLSIMSLGLIGFGRISRKVAEYAKVFGLKIMAYDPYVSKEDMAQLGVESVSLEALYAKADIISVSAPLTKENYRMINADSIAKMKDGVMIVNTGRGPLIDTNALIAGLESGKIKAAGLDVLEEEPLRDPNAKILSFDQVILTSHIAYDSEQAVGDNFQKATNTVINVMAGERPFNVLNKEELAKQGK